MNEICWLAVAIAGVWVAELLNTAIEHLGDAITDQTNELIRNAKDLAAAAVLIASIAAVVIGLCVFIPHLT